MESPPSEAGAVQLTSMEALPAVTRTLSGASGTRDGVTDGDEIDGMDVPRALVATTLNR